MNVRTARVGLYVNALLLGVVLALLMGTMPADAGWTSWMLCGIAGVSMAMGVLGQQMSTVWLVKRQHHDNRAHDTNQEQREAHDHDARRSTMWSWISIAVGLLGLMGLMAMRFILAA